MISRTIALLAFALASTAQSAMAGTNSSPYIAFTDSEPYPVEGRGPGNIRHTNYWRTYDGRVRMELPLLTYIDPPPAANQDVQIVPYHCVLPIVIGQPTKWIVVNRLNNCGVVLPRTTESPGFIKELERELSFGDMCPSGGEVQWLTQLRATHPGEIPGELDYKQQYCSWKVFFDKIGRAHV